MSYTTVEQSKKLIEMGMNPETADMKFRWDWNNNCPEVLPIVLEYTDWKDPGDIPCWSLDALLHQVPFPDLWLENIGGGYMWRCSATTMVEGEIDFEAEEMSFESPIDCCYKLLVKLLEDSYV